MKQLLRGDPAHMFLHFFFIPWPGYKIIFICFSAILHEFYLLFIQIKTDKSLQLYYIWQNCRLSTSEPMAALTLTRALKYVLQTFSLGNIPCGSVYTFFGRSEKYRCFMASVAPILFFGTSWKWEKHWLTWTDWMWKNNPFHCQHSKARFELLNFKISL